MWEPDTLRPQLTVNGAKVDTRDVVDRMRLAVEAAVAQATATQWLAGHEWYEHGLSAAVTVAAAAGLKPGFQAEVFGSDLIAVLSPGTSWEHNVKAALDVAVGLDAADITYQGYFSILQGKAVPYRKQVASGAVPTDIREGFIKGPKTNDFAFALRNPLAIGRPVIDRHMLKLAGIHEKSLANAGVYDAIAYGTALAGERFGLRPFPTQAISWLTVRPQPKLAERDGLPLPY